jgi:hypothetical protein
VRSNSKNKSCNISQILALISEFMLLLFRFQTAKKGMTKKSIFASPDNVNGRVGIGTCGMSGKPMTEFTTAEKWRKGV